MKGLIDSTLREGEQTVGISFTLAQKTKIIAQLIQLGIEEIELGVAGVRNPELASLIHAARVAGAGRLALWCRCLPADIDCAIAMFCGDDTSTILTIKSRKRLGKEGKWFI